MADSEASGDRDKQLVNANAGATPGHVNPKVPFGDRGSTTAAPSQGFERWSDPRRSDAQGSPSLSLSHLPIGHGLLPIAPRRHFDTPPPADSTSTTPSADQRLENASSRSRRIDTGDIEHKRTRGARTDGGGAAASCRPTSTSPTASGYTPWRPRRAIAAAGSERPARLLSDSAVVPRTSRTSSRREATAVPAISKARFVPTKLLLTLLNGKGAQLFPQGSPDPSVQAPLAWVLRSRHGCTRRGSSAESFDNLPRRYRSSSRFPAFFLRTESDRIVGRITGPICYSLYVPLLQRPGTRRAPSGLRLDRAAGVVVPSVDLEVADQQTRQPCSARRTAIRTTRQGEQGYLALRKDLLVLHEHDRRSPSSVPELVDVVAPPAYLITGGRALQHHHLSDQHFFSVAVLCADTYVHITYRGERAIFSPPTGIRSWGSQGEKRPRFQLPST